MKWVKKGLIITPTGADWMRTHAMIPTLEHREGSLYRIYFSGRDTQNRSLVSYAEINLEQPEKVVRFSPKPVLGLGALGCFDDNGVTPSWIVKDGKRTLLYYIGWNKGATVRMHLFGGLAISEDGGETFERYSRAPILERTTLDPYLNTAPCVLKENNRWRMWYVSGLGWDHPDLPRYHIKYAESSDGRSWERKGVVSIDFKAAPEEHALARPCVVKDKDLYRMWYAYKGKNYRLGYAESTDGISWKRKDNEVGLDVSPMGWDSEMIEYAYVLTHAGKRYMFYNGNDYGRDGIGLALEQ